MSTILKMLFGLLVVVCLAQLIQSAPHPEEETKPEDAANKLLADIAEKFKEAFNEENIKKLVDSASDVLGKGAKTLEEQMNTIRQQLEHANEKKE